MRAPVADARRRDRVLVDARASRAAGGIARGRARALPRRCSRRWEESEDLHYSLNALAWAAGVFAEHGRGGRSATGSCARSRRSPPGTATARRSRCSPRALGELAPCRGRPARGGRALPARASTCTGTIELPHDRAELLVSAAAAARDAGRDDQAREWLGDARAQRRGASARGRCWRQPSARWRSSAPADRRRGGRRPHAAAAAGHPARRRGTDEPRDRDRAVPLGAHGRHARPPLADRARLPLAPRRGAQGRRARPARGH